MSRATTLAALAVTGAAAATLAGQASAHPASVSCGPDGPVVTAPAYHGASASVTTAGGIATVTWSDGYTLTLPLPTGCVVPPVTPPAPPPSTPPMPVPPETPPVVVTPPAPRPPLVPHKRVRVIRVHGCAAAGGRSWIVRRTTVTWTRGGVVAKHKVHTSRRIYTGRCRVPAVTG